jgi:hypothetical protein
MRMVIPNIPKKPAVGYRARHGLGKLQRLARARVDRPKSPETQFFRLAGGAW